jgi:hypothetical protein
MSEERVFWGIEKVPKPLKGNPFLSVPFTAPDGERSRAYPVFDSREKAATYVREAYARSEHDIVRFALQDILDSIRKIEPNEILSDDDVLLNGDKPVKWSELTGDDAPLGV